MLSSHKDKLGRALPGGTRAAQRLALRSSLREDGSSTPHQTEPAGPHRASSEPTDTGDTLQGPSIPTTSCCEALCQLPFIPGQLSSTPGRHLSAPVYTGARIHPALAHSTLQGQLVLHFQEMSAPPPLFPPAFRCKFSSPSPESWALSA